jgi:hypothetical protein
MPVGIKIFVVSLFTGLPWLIAAGMAFWMVYETTDPRAAEIGRQVQFSLMGGLALVGLIGLVLGWLCFTLYRRKVASWWAARFSLWVLLGLWVALAVRVFGGQRLVLGGPSAAEVEIPLVAFALLVNLACMAFIERNRPIFDPTLSRPRL